MSSLIPKISLGISSKRSKSNLSFDSQTTANIGFVQPTMCRMLVPDSSINVKNRTLVRMSPLVNPTFGRLSQRDYFTFVRMSDLFLPWAEFLAGKPYANFEESWIPTSLPRFDLRSFVAHVITHNSYIGISPGSNPYITFNANSEFTRTEFNNMIESIMDSLESYRIISDYSDIRFGDDTAKDDPFGLCSIVVRHEGRDSSSNYYKTNSGFNGQSCNIEPVTYQNSDLTIWIPADVAQDLGTYSWREDESTVSSYDMSQGYYLHFRLKQYAKNLRKVLIGLGYSWSIFDVEQYTPFAFLAFYKAWFETFHPLRNIQFTDTLAYRIIKQTETTLPASALLTSLCEWFDTELKDAFYYYTSPDYFSASLYNLGDNTLDNGQYETIQTPMNGNINSYTSGGSRSSVTQNAYQNGSSYAYGVGLEIMRKLMKFTNKNNVIGRSIRDYAKTHYNIDDLQSDANLAVKINSHKIDINFDDVTNLSASNDAYLGEYAGKGIGYKQSDTTYFTTPDFGFFICMSVVVPESGYYQGSLKENKIADKFEFFTPEFDALGYDVITRGEIKNDFDTESADYRPTDFDTAKGFGFIPRYSHFKVARNIVNGDLTLRSTREGLQGYYLDKQFPSIREIDNGFNTMLLREPSYTPQVVSDKIRMIDPSDNIGNYNRIFQYTDTDVDHFIIQKVFDVEITAPWKSLSDSFDTINSEDNVINRNHQ